MPILIDHLFVLIFAVIYPLYGWYAYRVLMNKLAAGEEIDRRKDYQETIACHWLLAIGGVVFWVSQSRSWADLGFGPWVVDWQLLLAVVIAVGIVGHFAYLAKTAVNQSDERMQQLESEIESNQLEALLPLNQQQLNWFYGLSITAGIVEEILWRGFLLWYLSHWLSEWGAAAAAIAVFGFGHIYQGWNGVLRTGLAGAAFMGLYLLSGSLWIPMLVHALADMLQGRMIFSVSHKMSFGQQHKLPDPA